MEYQCNNCYDSYLHNLTADILISNNLSWSSNFTSIQTAQVTNISSHSTYSLGVKVVLGIILEFIVFMTIAGNILVLFSVFINRRLRTTTNYLIVSLAAADLLLGLLVLPFSAILEIQHQWIFGSLFCDIWASTDVLCCTASILSLCAISIDRYIGVTKPLNHRNIMSTRRTLVLILALWILSFVISLGPLIGWRDKQRDPTRCTVTTKPGYVIFSVTCSFYIPSIIIISIYMRIYKEAKIQAEFLKTGFKKANIKHLNANGEKTPMVLRAVTRRNMYSQSSEGSFLAETDNSSPLLDGNLVNGANSPTSPRFSSTARFRYQSQVSTSSIDLQTRQSTDSLNSMNMKPRHTSNKLKKLGKQLIVGSKIAKFNKEKKAAKTLGIVVGVFFCCWFPFFFILPLDSLCRSCHIPEVLFDIVFWLGYCNSMINPIIYATWNKEFKRTFIAILRGKCRHRRRHRYSIAFLATSSATQMSQTVLRSEPAAKLLSAGGPRGRLVSSNSDLMTTSMESMSILDECNDMLSTAANSMKLSSNKPSSQYKKSKLQTIDDNESLYRKESIIASDSCSKRRQSLQRQNAVA